MPAALAQAAPRRLATFAAGRVAGQGALEAAGCTLSHRAIGRDNRGAPLWPEGWTGSITHTDTDALAVVAPTNLMRYIGVDAEQLLTEELAHALHSQIAPELPTGSAQGALGTGEPLPFPLALTLVFTAKEALYKALAPTVRDFFGFDAAECSSLGVASGQVCLRLTTDLAGGFEVGTQFNVRVEVLKPGLVLAWFADGVPSHFAGLSGH